MKSRKTELHQLTGSYALDAVDEPDLDAFERHLARCGPCVTEVRGLSETAARLAVAAAVPPPPAMHERVMAATYRTRQLAPLTSPAQTTERHGTAARRIRIWLPVAVTAASLAAATALTILQVHTQNELDNTRASQNAVAAVLAAPDAKAGSGPAAHGGTVTVVISAARDTAVVAAAGMPALPGTEVYQLWLIGPDGTRSAGLLPAEQSGRTGPVLAAGIRAGDRLGITIEPAGGTAQPTTTPLLDMTMPAR